MEELFCQDIAIPCRAGILEGRIQYKEGQTEQSGVILCPPHPLLAGNIDNNVITHLAGTLAHHLPVLSFNYRNVGKSFKTGELPLYEYWQKLDELNDFSSIIDDTRQLLDWSARFCTQFHLVGYSFGSFIALEILPKTALSFTAITPPLAEHDFSKLAHLDQPTLIILAEDDSLLGATSLTTDVTTHTIQGDHFFLQQEEEVSRRVTAFILGI